MVDNSQASLGGNENSISTYMSLASFSWYTDIYCTSPRNTWTSMANFGTGQFKKFSTFKQLASMPKKIELSLVESAFFWVQIQTSIVQCLENQPCISSVIFYAL